jgi:hypothetical protein
MPGMRYFEIDETLVLKGTTRSCGARAIYPVDICGVRVAVERKLVLTDVVLKLFELLMHNPSTPLCDPAGQAACVVLVLNISTRTGLAEYEFDVDKWCALERVVLKFVCDAE